jgi:beta-glucuronidase
MKRFFLRLLLCLLIASPLCAATRIDLNDHWHFRTDVRQEGESAGWSRQEPGGTESVTLPHTWSLGEHLDYEGVAWYFHSFQAPALAAGTHVELHFGGAFDHARVYLNGVELGRHDGGFTEFSFDVTAKLRGENYLAVELDNRPTAKSIPGVSASAPHDWYDWWHWGGLVREAWLSVTPSSFVRRQQIRTTPGADAAAVQDDVVLENFSGTAQHATLRAEVLDAAGGTVASVSKTLTLPVGTSTQSLALSIAHPHRWTLDRPELYTLRVQLRDGNGHLLDEQIDNFGVRTVEVRDRHLLLNGERVRLSGIARHEDSPWEGMAETRGTILHDYDDMKALHVTLTRPVHYPQNQAIFDYADRHGILLIPEIPLWQFDAQRLGDPAVQQQAMQQMREMIEQAGNHPSIFAWSVSNESWMSTPEGRDYFHKMREMIRTLDPQRLVSYADVGDGYKTDAVRREESPFADADFLLINEYFGTWHGTSEELAPVLDRINRLFPDKMVIISEFGTPGIFAKDSEAADRLRAETIRRQMDELGQRDWIGGVIFWCYQDYRSHRNLWPGEEAGFVDHGLVDENRQRRPSYYVWQERNAPAEIAAQWKGVKSLLSPNAFAVTLTPRGATSIPYHPLRGYKLMWRLQDAEGNLAGSGEQELETLEQAVTLEQSFARPAKDDDLRLTVTLRQAGGVIAAQKILLWHKPLQGGRNASNLFPSN